MSWSVFKAQLGALTGIQHLSRQQYANTVATAYDMCIMRHFDTLSGGGKVIVPGKALLLEQQILGILELNATNHAQVNLVQQFGPAIKAYWTGAQILGPAGSASVNFTGVWLALPMPQNMSFQIMINNIAITAQIHLLSLVGTHKMFSFPWAVVPWSGGFLRTV